MYRNVCVAGTFDRLHKGHEAVLRSAFESGEKVVIGLTSDKFVRKFKTRLPEPERPPADDWRCRVGSDGGQVHNSQFSIQSFAKRKTNLELLLLEHGYSDKAFVIISIDDTHGPLAITADVDALVVTSQNKSRGEEINALRRKNGLRPMTLIEVPLVLADDGTPVGSTRICNGEIDKNGRFVMPDNLRTELREPLGRIIPEEEIPSALRRCADNHVITVGDKATKRLLDAGVDPILAIIDRQVGRKKYTACYTALCKRTSYKERMKALKSGPGYISKEALVAVEDWSRNPTTLAMIIDGEEDLLALPVIVWAPLGSVVYYGQPGDGLVEVVVTQPIRKKIRLILTKFIS